MKFERLKNFFKLLERGVLESGRCPVGEAGIESDRVGVGGVMGSLGGSDTEAMFKNEQLNN